MKPLLSIVLVVLALSLCNLMGRRSNTNSNANDRQSGSSSEASASPSPQLNVKPPESTDSGTAPSSNNERSASQTTTSSSRPGVPSSLPGVSQATPRPIPPKTISGGVLNGKATSLPQPAYPPIAKAAHASGSVSVQVLVDESGNVLTASAVSGHPLLKQSAVQAARQAKFRPTLLSGQPVKVTGIIVYNFAAQ